MTSTRDGFALFTALVSILVVSALVAAVSLRADEEGRAARSTTLEHSARASAEGAIWRTFVSADAQAIRHMPIGSSSQSTLAAGELTQNVTVIKIDTALAVVIATTRVLRGRNSAAHRVSLWTRLPADTSSTRLLTLPAGAWADLY